MILVSACLLGINCKYNGNNNLHEKTLKLGRKVIPFCPEQLGGLSTPRQPAEIIGGDGYDVLLGNAKVVTDTGKDVTSNFIKGAEMSAILADLTQARTAVLKANSPSCGVNCIYDGTFSRSKCKGDGVTAALLKQKGLQVITELDL
jgi:uncharacterized protein YbbK (DUF523 family)